MSACLQRQHSFQTSLKEATFILDQPVDTRLGPLKRGFEIVWGDHDTNLCVLFDDPPLMIDQKRLPVTK